MRVIPVCLLLSHIACVGLAHDFYLVHGESGNKYGPFDYNQQAEVEIEGTSYRLLKIDKQAIVEDLMRSIIIPRMEFREASLVDVVEFLRKASEQHDPEKRGINMVLKIKQPPAAQMPSVDQDTTLTDWPDDQNFTALDEGFEFEDPSIQAMETIPRVTMEMKKISIYDAVRIISEYANLEFTIRENIVELRSKE